MADNNVCVTFHNFVFGLWDQAALIRAGLGWHVDSSGPQLAEIAGAGAPYIPHSKVLLLICASDDSLSRKRQQFC